MLNDPVEREIAAGLWLYEALGADTEAAKILIEEVVFADAFDEQNERIWISTTLLQCNLLLQFLQLLWK